MHRKAMGRMSTGCAGVAVAMLAASICCDVTEAADKLTPINPHKVGGLVLAKLATDAEGLTIHTNVVIAPVSSVRSRAKCNWWIPGGKSATLYVDWVNRNGGKVARDMTAKFSKAPEAAIKASGKKK